MLYLFYEGGSPIGIFDLYLASPTEVAVNDIQGGMLGFFKSTSDTDDPTIPLGDGFDEYGGSSGVTANIKTVISPATTQNGLGVSSTAVTSPLLLLDDGHTGYGLTFGHQFGYDTGSSAYKYFHSWNNGGIVGPNTIAGSGKVTAWFRDGLYGTDFYDWTTLDPLDAAKTPTPGDPLHMLPASAKFAMHGAGSSLEMTQAYFVSFLGDPSVVSTSFPTTGADTAHPVMLFMWKNG